MLGMLNVERERNVSQKPNESQYSLHLLENKDISGGNNRHLGISTHKHQWN